MADYVPGSISGAMNRTVDRLANVDRVRAMAELAAREFEQIPSDNARFWADQVRRNPEAAFTMAKQYGGLDKVSQALRGAYARGAAANAATPGEVDAVLFEHSPEDYTRLQQGRLMGAQAFQMGRPKQAFDMDAASKLRKDYTSRSGNFETIRHFYEIAAANAAEAAADPDNPGAVDFALVQAYGKMLDPNSVVRNEEGRFIVESQSSDVEDALNRFARLFSAAGTLNPQARFNLMRQIQATYDKAAERQSRFLEDVERELDQLGARGVEREFATPIGIQLSGDRLDLSPWEAMLGGGRQPQTQRYKVGQILDQRDREGNRLRVVGFDEDGEPLVEVVDG